VHSAGSATEASRGVEGVYMEGGTRREGISFTVECCEETEVWRNVSHTFSEGGS